MVNLWLLFLLLVASQCFKLNDKSNVTAVFLTCCGRHDMLKKTLEYFRANNTYPIKQIILVNDGPLTATLLAEIAGFANLTVLSTGQKVGQIISIDMAYALVSTPYVYYCEDDRWLIKKGLIQMNIRELEKDPTLLQVWNNKHIGGLDSNWYADPKSYLGCFSFHPSVNRMDLYKKLPGGYKFLTDNMSYGSGAGEAELKICDFYRYSHRIKQAYRVQNGTKVIQIYFENPGATRGLPRK